MRNADTEIVVAQAELDLLQKLEELPRCTATGYNNSANGCPYITKISLIGQANLQQILGALQL